MLKMPYSAVEIHSSVQSFSRNLLESSGWDFTSYFSFGLFGLTLLVGVSLNILYLWWSRYRASSKGCNRGNAFLQSIAIANLILLVALPLDSGNLIYGSWVFNKEWCSIYHIITRSMFFTIASILVQYTKDSFQPFGFPKGRFGLGTSWMIGVIPFLLLYFTTLKVDSTTGAIRCIPAEKSVFAMPVCIALEMFYIAGFPVLSMIYYKSKNQFQDDEITANTVAGIDDFCKTKSRDLNSKLSVLLMICYLPWRFVVIFDMEWAYNYLPLHVIIFGVLPLMLSYTLTIAFPLTCVMVEKGIFELTACKISVAKKPRKGSNDQLQKKGLI
ncbi:atypical chemokine receptor 3-like [Actinia tenebrosa]|uniref:Atypical chemokine receptor 3-like n=1 Tax=Actinia tenebrosa TaxID=6105 RepID=A0A6P8H370_ACTTE|nr:atypical chemokine receptor 3-like [Actinia tenebrosa]